MPIQFEFGWRLLLLVGLAATTRLPLLAQENGLYQGKIGDLLPTPAELGADWVEEHPHSPASREAVYRLERDKSASAVVIFVELYPGRNTEETRNQYLVGRRIPTDFAWKMKAVPDIGERGQTASGKLMAYLHFARANFYVVLKALILTGSSGEAEGYALTVVARTIDSKLLAAVNRMPARLFEETLTQDQVDRIAPGIIPMVEDVSGRKFARKPSLRVVGTDELVGACLEDLRLQHSSEKRPGKELEFALSMDRRGRMLGLVSLGRFSYSRREILLPAETFFAGLQRAKIETEHADDALRIVIGHELVHALQDQETPLGERLVSFKTSESRAAFSAVIEGHAVLLQKMIAARLGVPDRIANLSAPSKQTTDAGSSAQERQFVETVSAATNLLYSIGPQYMERLFQKGGNPRLWEAVANPPTSTSALSEVPAEAR